MCNYSSHKKCNARLFVLFNLTVFTSGAFTKLINYTTYFPQYLIGINNSNNYYFSFHFSNSIHDETRGSDSATGYQRTHSGEKTNWTTTVKTTALAPVAFINLSLEADNVNLQVRNRTQGTTTLRSPRWRPNSRAIFRLLTTTKTTIRSSGFE